MESKRTIIGNMFTNLYVFLLKIQF